MYNFLDYMIKTRRYLHKIPEIAFNEFKTSEFICSELKKLNISFEKIGTSIIATLFQNKGNKILFRADMDALPIIEKNAHSFCSNNGFMHACGHDGHMSILLGFAKYLSMNPQEREVVLVFQAGEEAEGGALKIIESGLIKNVTECYAVHVDPDLEVGLISIKDGFSMAGSFEFDLTIYGESSHCAEREKGIDSLFLSNKIYLEIYEMMKDYPLNILHFGKLTSGVARNVLSNETKMFGTLRYFDNKIKEEILNKVQSICKKNAKYSLEKIVEYIPVINSVKTTNKLRKSFNYVEGKLRYTAEDFAYFLNEFDGTLIWLGGKIEKEPRKLHSEYFDFDESSMFLGLNIFIKLLND